MFAAGVQSGGRDWLSKAIAFNTHGLTIKFLTQASLKKHNAGY